MLLKRISYQPPTDASTQSQFPFNLAWLNQLENLEFKRPVTIFIGENGAGKSTLLETIAYEAQAITLSNRGFDQLTEYKWIDAFAQSFKLIWTNKRNSGFFFRADDFITFVRETKERQQEAIDALAEIDRRDPQGHSLERMPYANALYEMKQLYPTDLSDLSHGQSFMSLFQARLRPNALYILDEPETPLSPQNQLSLLYLIDDYAKQGSQFIISTHSPILMAYPEADLYEISVQGITPTKYHDIEHVQFMQNFMQDPQRFMYHMFK
nr:AAA family ATPase [Fundicoccus culcitae]